MALGKWQVETRSHPFVVRRRPGREETRSAWWLLSPTLAWMAVFVAFPVGFSVYLSFHRWDLVSVAKPYVGLENYSHLLHSTVFYQALVNTLYFTGGTVVLIVLVALGLALLVSRQIRGQVLLRAIFYSPVVVSMVAAATIWSYLYDPQFGTIDALLNHAGLVPLPWLSSPTWAMPAVILMTVWKESGFYMVIYLAALLGIPSVYYEAASVDGASAWQGFWRITWPLLRPATILVVIMTIINSFQVFGQIYVMTSGGPVNATMVLVYYLYKEAFVNFRMGYASAIGFVLFLVIFTLSIVQFRLLRGHVET